MIAAIAGRSFGGLPEGITGISIDSRTIKPGEAFFAIKGDRVDGHDYANLAMGERRGVDRDQRGAAAGDGPTDCAEDRCRRRIGSARQAGCCRPPAYASPHHRCHRICRQNHHEGDAAPDVVAIGQGACLRSLFQQSLGRAAQLLARMPQDTDFGVFEIGMNHPEKSGR